MKNNMWVLANIYSESALGYEFYYESAYCKHTEKQILIELTTCVL